MNKCPYCQSILICWNWVYVPQSNFESMNPHLPPRKGHYYGHECWACTGVFDTDFKPKLIIPHWLLKLIYWIKSGEYNG